MAEFKQFTYTNNGTEIDFMQGLVDLICGLDDSITVEDANGNPTTVAEQYADLTSASTARFYVNFGNNQRLDMRRNFANSAGCRNFVFNGYNALYSLNNLGVMDRATRSFLVIYLKSENLLVFWIGAYNATSISGAIASALVLKTTNDRFANVQTNVNVLNYNLVGSNSTVTYSPIFAYSAGAGNIDFAEKAIFVSGGVKAIETEDIKSCSTMPQFASIALPDGRNFFTIATNAMVEV